MIVTIPYAGNPSFKDSYSGSSKLHSIYARLLRWINRSLTIHARFSSEGYVLDQYYTVMLFDLPDRETLYHALLERDDRYDGHAYVCVSTTRVFCRLTCPARKPKFENCTFYATIAECIDAGCRACKRCHPMRASALADPTIKVLLAELDKNPDTRWSEEHILQLGFDPSTVRRSFKRQFAMTFLEMARQRRLR